MVRDLEGKISEYPEEHLNSLPTWKTFELSETLAELGDKLKMLTRRASIPHSGWMPEIGQSNQSGCRVAHRAEEKAVRRGLALVSLCGADCYPFYGRDSEKKILTHPKCGTCERLLDDQLTGTTHAPTSAAG